MENIVYILGAGFSAPLGLPVMSNFLSKSKDMYFDEPTKYDYFKEVFTLIESLSYIKNYYEANLFNIEEIFSILEMKYFLNDTNKTDLFKKYISDVINYYTPNIKKYPKKLPNNYYDFIIGSSQKIHKLYGNFIVNLLNLKFKKNEQISVEFDKKSYNYSIITMNYDKVIENYFYHLVDFYDDLGSINIVNNESEFLSKKDNKFSICKLHGCVNKDNIIPPTWNKNSDKTLIETWQFAHKLLEDANHIRIIGYSLPLTDTYITYLLKSSILGSDHLKTIDVITLDNNGLAKKNYDQFIDFHNYKFKNINLIKYLEFIANKKKFLKNKNTWNRSNKYIKFNFLETTHNEFMNTQF